MKRSVVRICGECVNENGSNIIIYRNECKDVVLFENKYYHTECFKKLCELKLSKRKIKKWINALNNIGEYEQNAKESINEYFDKDDVYRFIISTYDLAIVPSYIWIKLDKIYKGGLNGMSVGIPPAHLYDMWKRQITNLNKIYDNNKRKGKEMDKVQRLNYDLSILVNKYDSYLTWLNQQKILAEQSRKEQQEKKEKIDYKKISDMKIQSSEKNEDDIEQLLDELF